MSTSEAKKSMSHEFMSTVFVVFTTLETYMVGIGGVLDNTSGSKFLVMLGHYVPVGIF